jgi:hypothetical protein
VSASDSLILAGTCELMRGGVASAHPLCPGAEFVLQPNFNRGAGQPETAVVAALLTDGSVPTGRRTENRTITLPVVIYGTSRANLNGAKEMIFGLVDQPKFPLQWTPDPQGGTALPLVYDCYRATEAAQNPDQDSEDELVAFVNLTFPAHPFGRSADYTVLPFPIPAVGWSSSVAPVRLDDFSTVSSSTQPSLWSSSAQVVSDSASARWSYAGSGGNTAPLYTHTLAGPVDITGLDRLTLNFGLGTSNYTLWHEGRVTFSLTLTDGAGKVATFGNYAQCSASNNPAFPTWVTTTFAIQNMPAGFNVATISAWSIKAWREVSFSGNLRMDADVYLNGLTATASANAPIAQLRGTVYNIGAPGGVVRTLMDAQFQPAAPASPALATTTFSTAGPITFIPGIGQTSGKIRVKGAAGKGGSRTTAGLAGGGGAGAGVGHDTYPMTPGQAMFGVVGAAGGSGTFPTLTTSYFVQQDGANGFTLATPSFTPAAGEVIVIKGVIEDAFASFGSPSGGGLTWTQRVNIGTAFGTSRCTVWTATVGATPSAMTVSVPFSGYPMPHAMLVERWGNAKLAGSPALLSSSGSGSAPSGTCTTVAAQSVVSWVNADRNAASSARTYRSSATEDAYHVVPSTYTGYWAWQQAAAAGAQTCGLTAPASQVWELAGIEIQSANTGGLTDGGKSSFDSLAFVADGGKSVPPDTTTGGLGGVTANCVTPAGGNTPLRGGNGFTAVTTGGGGGSSAGDSAQGNDAAGQAGAAAPTGGGAGGAGGAAGGNNPGVAGSAPGGASGGAVSTSGAVSSSAAANGSVAITTTAALPNIKTLIVHVPGYDAPATFSPLIPVGSGLDAPDGREYTIPSPVPGLNARYAGTYTIITIWLVIDTPSAQRTHTVTFKQYPYVGGTPTVRTVSRVLTPSAEIPAILNGYVTLDEVALPCRDIADDQTSAFTTAGVTSTNAADRCMDIIVADVSGQLLVYNDAVGAPNLWADAPELNKNRDWGRVLASPYGRESAVSALDSVAAMSGGPLVMDPEGPGWMLAYSPDAGAPALTAGFWRRWRDSRLY